MRPSSVSAVQVLKVSSPGSDSDPFASRQTDDLLAVEEPLEISMIYGSIPDRKQQNISVTMCTPGHDEELAAGFLFTEGIIRAKEDILSVSSTRQTGNNAVVVELDPGVRFDPKKIERHFYTSSSCGVCGKSSVDAVRNISCFKPGKDELRVSADLLTRLPDTLRKKQEVFEHTGGLHASALFNTGGELLISREDVGRHNALDKLVGAMLQENRLPLDNHILLLSGRASFELIQKAAMAGIPVVCAVGAPSSLAVSLAEECGMTLVGFLRDGRFNIYCGAQRILI